MQAASEFALDPSGAAERYCRLFSEGMGKQNPLLGRLEWEGKEEQGMCQKLCVDIYIFKIV